MIDSRQVLMRLGVCAVALLIAGCGTTSTSSRCENAECDVTLNGQGADVELDTLGVTVTLQETGEDSASLLVSGSEEEEAVEVRENTSEEVLDLSITLESLGEGEVELQIGPA